MSTVATSDSPLWLERYRPGRLAEVVGNDLAVRQLTALVQSPANMPHILLSGPPGCGKTSTAHCVARDLLGPEGMARGLLELNASDERGIDVVRTRIRNFAQEAGGAHLRHGYRIVVLDEADAMTTAAQQAMRSTMETYATTTRFILLCNNSSKIMEPIQSRCGILRFSKVADATLLQLTRNVAQLERVDFDDDALDLIVFAAQGDCRKALTTLQSVHVGQGRVTKESVLRVCDTPSPEVLVHVFAHCQRQCSRAAMAQLHELWDKGYSAEDILKAMFSVLKMDEQFPMQNKVHWLRVMSEGNLRFAEGCSGLLQFDRIICQLCAPPPGLLAAAAGA